MINDQLQWIVNLFNDNNITYWLDSGTLLGIIRDGCLIKGDNDIDIGMWADDFDKIKILLLSNNMYKQKTYAFKHHFFKIKLFNSDHKYKIDINFFRKEENYSWCPQAYPIFIQNPQKLLQKITFPIIAKLKSKWPYSIDYDNILWKYFHLMGVWWIPNKYFDNLTNLEGNLTIPKNYQDYLSFRYGNWKVKNTDWDFWLDDNAIKHNVFQYVKKL